MDNQNILNGVSLEEASRIISQELIKKKVILLEMRKTYYENRKQYESDYVAANDGDSSENAPLEAAIQHLREVNGDIAINEAVIQSLEGIEDLEYLLGTYEFEDIIDTYKSINVVDRETINSIYNITSAESLADCVQKCSIDDLTSMLNQHVEYNQNNGNPSNSVILFNKIKDYYDVRRKPPYNYCGLIVPYTTVRLKLVRGTEEEFMTYKILPAGLSFLDIGIIASDSRVAQAILGKQKGDIVSIQHSSGSVILKYEILDIY